MCVAESQFDPVTDGRVSFNVYGAPADLPILYCHGLPGSRLEPACAINGREDMPYCVLAPDRPGYGNSGADAPVGYQQWAKDVGALVDHLGWDEFSILGFSGGAPYALACAALFGERVTKLSLCSGLAPFQVLENRASLPESTRAYYELAESDPSAFTANVTPFKDNPAALVDLLTTGMPPSERAFFSNPEIRSCYLDNIEESFRQGVQGLVQDCLNYIQDWRIDWQAVKCPVDLFYGALDPVTPASFGNYFASVLPHARLIRFEEDGHYLLLRRWDQILNHCLKPR